MSFYALVEDGSVTKVCGLPHSWKNISNLPKLSNAELKTFGWLPFTQTVVETTKYQVKNGVQYEISDDGVVGVEQKRDMTTDEKTAKDQQESESYKHIRKMKYDSLNQFDLMYEDKVNSTNTWGEAIEAIKKAHPKPE